MTPGLDVGLGCQLAGWMWVWLPAVGLSAGLAASCRAECQFADLKSTDSALEGTDADLESTD